MRKIMTLVGTRPELIKMSRVIAELDAHTRHILVHSGQNYDDELNEIFFGDLGIRKPDYFLDVARDGVAQTIAEVLVRTDALFDAEQPEALLLYGDTNTCLAVIAAKRRKIPVFHMEAGNRCFDERVPEELNRKVVDHLSDVNMVLSEHARRYLIAEGIRPETVFKTGSHLPEVFAHAKGRVEASDVVARLALEPERFFIASAHREETVDTPERLRELLRTLRAVAAEWKMPVVFSTHPRTRKRLDALGETTSDPMIRFVPPFSFTEYVRLLMDCFCVLSDSGSITEEASLLNVPAVTIRDTHERPEGMDVGTLMMSDLRAEHVLDAVCVVTQQHNRARRVFPPVPDYGAGPVSKQVVRIVLSYIDYVNRTVWRRKYE